MQKNTAESFSVAEYYKKTASTPDTVLEKVPLFDLRALKNLELKKIISEIPEKDEDEDTLENNEEVLNNRKKERLLKDQWISIDGEKYMVSSLRSSNEEIEYCNLVTPFTTKNGIEISAISLEDISSKENEMGYLEGEINLEEIDILNIEGEEIFVCSQFQNFSLTVSYYDPENNELVFASGENNEVFVGIYKISAIFWDNESNQLKYKICKDFSERDAVWEGFGSPSNENYTLEKYTDISQQGGVITGTDEYGHVCSFPYIEENEENISENQIEYLKTLKKYSILKVVLEGEEEIQDASIQDIDPENHILSLRIEDSRNEPKQYTLERIQHNGILKLKETSKIEKVINAVGGFLKK